jgi:hypothetical protein
LVAADGEGRVGGAVRAGAGLPKDNTAESARAAPVERVGDEAFMTLD